MSSRCGYNDRRGQTITISPELEARPRERASRDGKDLDTVAETLLAAALAWDEREYAEAVVGIRRGLETGAAGRVRPASEVFTETRKRLSTAEP